MKIFVWLMTFSLTLVTAHAELSENGFFSGRLSRINKEISIIRVKVDFDNVKYLNPKDKIEFWDEKNNSLKCKGYLVARTADYLLVKVMEMSFCEKNLYINAGAYFKFFSEDLLNNIKMGKEVVTILLKKRLAVIGQMELKNRELNASIERVNAINARYKVLRDKLELEWQKELHSLDEDKTFALRSYKDLERRRDEIDQKLEQYKLKDENLTLDRWSLDTNLYFKK